MESAFHVMRAALYKLASDSHEAETMARNPCPDYLEHMAETLERIRAAQSIDQLAAVPWITGQAALGGELI